MKGAKTMKSIYRIRDNYKFNSREVEFDGKPDEAIRDALKGLKMRWHNVNKCWYGYATEQQIRDAIFAATPEIAQTETAVVTDGYMGGGAVYGAKSNRCLYGADLSTAIREDIKHAGIKDASVRVKSYSGGQSITVTLRVPSAGFVSLEDYVSGYTFAYNRSWIQTPDGEIHIDKYYTLDADEQERVRKYAAEQSYKHYTGHEHDRRGNFDRDEYLTPQYVRTVGTLIKIIEAYRYDESNGMVDYFNTNFYWDLRIKPV